MTVVRFPTKVRLTVVRGADWDPLVDAAIDAADVALTRAVRHAAQLHLIRDAAGDPSRRPTVDVRIRGEGLSPDLTHRLRSDLTGLMLARAAQLYARPHPRGVGQTSVRSTRPAEPFDGAKLMPDRRSPVDDAYMVPSYDGGGQPVALPVGGSSRAAHTARSRQAAQPTHLRLIDIASRDAMEAQLARYYGGNAPPLLVAIYRAAGTPVATLMRVEPSGRILGYLTLGGIVVYEPPTDEGTGHWHRASIFDLDAIEFDREASSPEERLAVRTEWWMQVLRMTAGGTHVTDAQLRRQATERARHMPDPGGVTAYYWLIAHGRRERLLEVDRSHIFTGRLPVAVLSERVSGSSESGGGSGESGADYDPPLPLDQLEFFEPDPAHPFLAEPPVDYWPPSIAGVLGDLIADVAGRLHMQPGRFPGMFVLAAVVQIRNAARHLGSLVGTGQQGDSPRMAVIRDLVAAFAPLEQLQQFYTRIIAADDNGLPRPVRHNTASWLLHFYEEYFPRRDDAVSALFVATCQDILLDVLETSHLQIAQRQQNFNAYMRITRALILLLMVDEPELEWLRQTLNDRTAPTWTSVAAGASEIGAWYGAARLVVDAMGQVEVDTGGAPQRGRIRTTPDGPQIQDSVGRWWSREELDSVLASGRQQAFAIDPLLEKISDLPDVVDRLRNAGAANVDAEFRSLLEDLRNENESKTQDVRDDVDIAFGLATFQEADITNDSSIGAQLSGIHANADAVLRPLFTGGTADVYVSGMRNLVASELGKAAFEEFFNIVGLTVIAIFCPPAAFAIGAVEAVAAVDTALEHRGIQRAMLGGDEILTKAQAEAELWGAAIGAALVFVPELPGLARGAAGGVRAVVRGEVREAAAVAGRELVQRAAAHLAEVAAQDLARVFATECLKGYLLGLAINGAVGRLTQAVAHEVQVTGHASIADLPRLISDAISGPAQGQP